MRQIIQLSRDVDRSFGAAVSRVEAPPTAAALPPPDQRRVPPQLAPQRTFVRVSRRGVVEPDRAHADAADRDELPLAIDRKPIAEFPLQLKQLGQPRRLRT